LMCDGTSFFIFGFIFHVWWNLSRTVISSRLCHSVKRAALLRLLLRPQQQQQQLYTLHGHPFTLGRGRPLSASILSGFIRRLLERDRWEKGIEHRRWDGKPTLTRGSRNWQKPGHVTTTTTLPRCCWTKENDRLLRGCGCIWLTLNFRHPFRLWVTW
jgi:hypothetical protein